MVDEMEIVGPIITLIVIVLFIFYLGYLFGVFIMKRPWAKRVAFYDPLSEGGFVSIKTQPEELIGYDTLKTYRKSYNGTSYKIRPPKKVLRS